MSLVMVFSWWWVYDHSSFPLALSFCNGYVKIFGALKHPMILPLLSLLFLLSFILVIIHYYNSALSSLLTLYWNILNESLAFPLYTTILSMISISLQYISPCFLLIMRINYPIIHFYIPLWSLCLLPPLLYPLLFLTIGWQPYHPIVIIINSDHYYTTNNSASLLNGDYTWLLYHH